MPAFLAAFFGADFFFPAAFLAFGLAAAVVVSAVGSAAAAVAVAPAAVHTPEGVTVHEFGHQYWYGMVGSNEFEESWLDEGLNTDSEYRAMELAYGPRVIDLPGGNERYADFQFGGDAFWEIKNGKKTRMVTDFTYNAITTDFWANLDLIGSQETWKMFGTGGDAKGQPTQTNSISHGSPYIRIKKIMVGAAFA